MSVKPYDLAIACPTYFGVYSRVDSSNYRRNLYRSCLQSLERVSWKGLRTLLIIRDDNSPEPPDIPMIKGLDLNYKVQINHLGMDGNCWDAVFTARDWGRWILWLDHDSLVAPDMVERAFNLVHQYPNAKGYSLYNSKYHPIFEDKGDHLLKKSMPELGALFRAEDLTINEPTILSKALDPCGIFPTLRPSVIQHTGRKGMNNPEEDDFDPEFQL